MSQSDIMIAVRGLSKAYAIAHNAKDRPTTLGEAAVRRLRSPFKREPQETFWALKDVSFDVKRGDVVGVIGRNGAGKSTLFKVLSRITEPTAGEVDLYGRVGSLLEVGTGFSGELTGRENIYLNGTILGMRRSEIAKRFDEIVDFSGVEQFLDTPVKRYSSGMYVRLAFAVAAHLETEILIVDEVLAVGDAEFQKRCLGKMKDVASNGRTVLFVSHNLAAVNALCGRSLVLVEGASAFAGESREATRFYLAQGSAVGIAGWQYQHRGRSVRIDSVKLLVNGLASNRICAGMPCAFCVEYTTIKAEEIGRPLGASLVLHADGQKMSNLWTEARGQKIVALPHGYVTCDISRWPFRSQRFSLGVYTHMGMEVQDWIEDALIFDSVDGDYYGSGRVTDTDTGIVFMDHAWHGTSVASGSLPLERAFAP